MKLKLELKSYVNTYRTLDYVEELSKKNNMEYEVVPLDYPLDKDPDAKWLLITSDLGIEKADFVGEENLYYRLYPKKETRLPYYVPTEFAEDEDLFKMVKLNSAFEFLACVDGVYDYSDDYMLSTRYDRLKTADKLYYDTKNHDDMEAIKNHFMGKWGIKVNSIEDWIEDGRVRDCTERYDTATIKIKNGKNIEVSQRHSFRYDDIYIRYIKEEEKLVIIPAFDFSTYDTLIGD